MYALLKLSDELGQSRKPGFPVHCTGSFTCTMGLPCAHKLQQRQFAHGCFYPLEIHQHQHFDPTTANTSWYEASVSNPQLLDPIPVRTHGQPPGSTSTRRNPSEFERVEQAGQAEQAARAVQAGQAGQVTRQATRQAEAHQSPESVISESQEIITLD